MGVGDEDVQVAVVVDVGELPPCSAEPAVLCRELGIALEVPAAAIVIQRQFLAAEDEQVAIACLEWIARGDTDRAGQVQMRGLAVEDTIPPHAEVLPADWRFRGRDDRHVNVAIVVEVVGHHRGDRCVGEGKPLFAG